MATATTNSFPKNSNTLLPWNLKIALVTFVILLRVLVGFHPHSGQDDYQGPNATASNSNVADIINNDAVVPKKKYGGDYEAQRHWMEITLHLPLSEWYYHDLEYWGLDYPPLTAYVSYACGWVAHQIGSLHDDAFGEDDETSPLETTTTTSCEAEDEVCQGDQEVTTTTTLSTSQTQAKKRRGLRVLKELVALRTSRYGFEDPRGKLFMRLTVLVLDVAIYMSAVWVLVTRLTIPNGTSQNNIITSTAKNNRFGLSQTQQQRIWLLLTALTQPAIILIDHGHFQYNTTSLGLALWSFHFMTMDTNPFFQTLQTEKNAKSPCHDSFVGPIIGSILFSLALNFKQMELYHAPAVFAYLLGRCFRQYSGDVMGKGKGGEVDQGVGKGGVATNRFVVGAIKFTALGITVIFTFAMLWLPFAISSPTTTTTTKTAMPFHIEGILQILRRLFPLQRGLFEGKVANLWCALSIKPFSIRYRIPSELLPLAALGLTLVLLLPPCWMLFGVGRGETPANEKQVVHRDRDIRLLLWGSTSTALAFFLASFQVHEKGILIPLAPLSLLALDAPNFVHWFSCVSTWTLWPLLTIDRLREAYVCCLFIYCCTSSMVGLPPSQSNQHDMDIDVFSPQRLTRFISPLSFIMMASLHVTELMLDPPAHLPDLFPVLWSALGCGMFCFSFLVTLWAMFVQTSYKNAQRGSQTKRKSKAKLSPVVGFLCLFGVIEDAFSYSPSTESGPIFVGRLHSTPAGCVSMKHDRLSLRPLRSSADGSNEKINAFITDDLLQRARTLLPWETYQAQDAKPVLNLSARHPGTLSLAEGADTNIDAVEETANDTIEKGEDTSWENGKLWMDTERELLRLGIILDSDGKTAARNIYGVTMSKMTPESILTRAPQLLRLPTTQITDAAQFFLCSGVDTTTIDTNLDATSAQWSLAMLLPVDPSLLTYSADDLHHGLEFLTNMMARGNRDVMIQTIRSQYSLSPLMATQLFRMGVDSGIDEQRVSNALGNASKASGKAVEGIVGDIDPTENGSG